MIRVVLDTNILISALLFDGTPGQIYDLRRTKKYQLISSEPLLNELRVVLNYAKFAARLVRADLTPDQIIDDYRQYIQVTEPTFIPEGVIRDDKDRKVLACAVGGQADYIVTGDKDLLILHPYQGINIILAADFLARLIA